VGDCGGRINKNKLEIGDKDIELLKWMKKIGSRRIKEMNLEIEIDGRAKENWRRRNHWNENCETGKRDLWGQKNRIWERKEWLID